MAFVVQQMRIPEPTARRTWLPPVVLVVMIAWLVLRESGALAVGDVFWHLRTGDLILDDGLPRSDPFSWTAGGESWQPNAWLGDVLWAGVRSLFGGAGVSLLGGAAVLAVALLLYRSSSRSGAGQWAAVAVSAAAIVFMSPFIAPRPLLIGFILLPIAMETAKRFRGGSVKSLLVLLLLIAAWSNLHGSFVTGVGVIGLIAVGWSIDEKHWLRPLTLAATAAIAGLMNPYGISAYLHTLDIRDESVNIDEWQPLAFDDARGLVLVVFMVAAAWALWRVAGTHKWERAMYGGSRRWEDTLPIAVLAVGTFMVIRTGAFLLIVAAPVVATALSGLKAPRVRAWATPRVGPLVTGLVLAGIILAAQQAPEIADAGKPGTRFSEEVVAAIPVNCPLLNEYDLGGFVIDRRWPDVLVSQDGRNDLYGADEIERQEALLSFSDADSFDQTGIRCVLADADRPLAEALGASANWEERARSSELVLLVKR
jgi:hypothetical protein